MLIYELIRITFNKKAIKILYEKHIIRVINFDTQLFLNETYMRRYVPIRPCPSYPQHILRLYSASAVRWGERLQCVTGSWSLALFFARQNQFLKIFNRLRPFEKIQYTFFYTHLARPVSWREIRKEREKQKFHATKLKMKTFTVLGTKKHTYTHTGGNRGKYGRLCGYFWFFGGVCCEVVYFEVSQRCEYLHLSRYPRFVPYTGRN